MKTKNLGLAIILTFFLGPLGLFYASITGGLIMCLIPLLLLMLSLLGVVTESELLAAGAWFLFVLFATSYWIICVIWAATSVSNRNNRVYSKARQAELLKIINETKSGDTSSPTPTLEKQIPKPDNHLHTARPTYQEWRKGNSHRSINDYYTIYGVPESTMKSSNLIQSTIQKESESGNALLYTFGAIAVLLILIVIFSYDKATKTLSFSKLSNSIGLSNDNKEIVNQIENVYFGLVNGAYTEQRLTGTTPENLPFYNSDLATLVVMEFAPLTMMSGEFSIEPKNIRIHKVDDNKADVAYDLIITNNGKQSTEQISMMLKKIGGKWKLDGQKFLPFGNEKTTKRKKK